MATIGRPRVRDRHGQAAPDAIGGRPCVSVGQRGACGRPASRRARARRAASSAACALALGRAGEREDPLGDVAQVLDRRRRAAGDADDAGAREGRGIGRGRATLSIWMAGVPAISHSRVSSLVLALRPPTDDDHQVDLAGRLERVLLAADRDRADRVDDLELVARARP